MKYNDFFINSLKKKGKINDNDYLIIKNSKFFNMKSKQQCEI